MIDSSSVTPGALFLTFEGIEGTGKSTQLARLAHRLRASGVDPVVTREPGGTELGRRLRAVLLEPTAQPFSPQAELLLYVADRAQHLTQVIEPALAAGRILLCDRYVDATVAYQGYGRELGPERIAGLHRDPPLNRLPRRTLLLDLEPELALARARERNLRENLDETEGRFERERLAFHRRVRQGYLARLAAEPQRIRRVDADGDPDLVEARIHAALADLLPLLIARSGRPTAPVEDRHDV